MQIHHINPLNLIKSLSMALELLSTNLSFHHWRVAIISMAIAEEMPLSYTECSTLLQAALLHDIGAATSWSARIKLRSNGWYHEKKIKGKYALHAYNGYKFLQPSHIFDDIGKIILYHHTDWQDSTTAKKTIPIQSRILRLADYLEVCIKPDKHILLQAEDITEDIIKKSGTTFSPEIVKYFTKISHRESFWLNIVDNSYAELFFSRNNFYGMTMPYTEEDVIDVAKIFANIIDEASGFTYRHSRSVSKVSVFLAQKKGFSEKELQDMMIAGLLHDIGKLSIPNSILEKPGALNKEEFALIRQHTYYTYRILQQIDGFQQIAEWAAYHHEYLDGSGYPFHLKGADLSLGSRIVAVADVFTALREDRPYRQGLPKEKILSIVLNMADNNKLDKKIVHLLAENYSTISLLVKGSGKGIDPR
ncbi:HD-GYP domain-containing protein [Pectinatus sottacetonis]|uniref:HD-GYP domain-containing protein n=1 Tax=Pectinatus sottacetonis TaxID=1002795 RepID=UPI0018C65AA9|nr:HD-GYP domain-containing protein [Pectinatus sottacetonis]